MSVNRDAILLALFIAAIVVLILICRTIAENVSMEKKVKNKSRSMDSFMNIWKNMDKKNDGPGCYVITISSKKKFNPLKYDDIYIGQSVKVYSRVHAHFTGHGNGNVYADIRNGKNVKVCIFTCRKKNLNKMEKYLIQRFDATKSYNVTKGGSAVRR